MPLEILRRPSGLFFFWLVASLSFPELVSAQTTYEGTLLEHRIERRYRKFSRCPIANRRRPRGFESDVVGGIGNFMITDIPSAFSCEIMRFSGGEAEVTMATENIMVQLDDPTILPGIVTLLNTQTVSTRISLNGSGRFTQGGDDHSACIGVAIGLEEAVDRIELRKVRPDGCADDRDYTTSTTRARDLQSEAECGVSVLTVVPNSAKTGPVPQSLVTEFEAEIISDFYIILDHGLDRGDDVREISNGASYSVTIFSRYKFEAEGTGGPDPTRTGCDFLPRNRFLPFHRPDEQMLLPVAPHVMTVRVVAQSAPPEEPVEVSVEGTRTVFTGPSGTPDSATGIFQTDENGAFGFEVNPPAASPGGGFDRTELVATGSVDGTDFSCVAMVVVGLGTQTSPLAGIPDVTALLGTFREQVLARVDPLQMYTDHPALLAEIAELVVNELRQRNIEGLVSLKDKVDRYAPVLRSLLDDEASALDQEFISDVNAFAQFLASRGGPHTRQAVSRFQADFRGVVESARVRGDHGDRFTETAAQPNPTEPSADDGTQTAFETASGSRLKIGFETNRGQADGRVLYLAHVPGYDLYLTSQEAVLVGSSSGGRASESSSFIAMRLEGARPRPKVKGLQPLPGKSHYLIGEDRAKWLTNIPHYAKVHYEDVYPGVDLVYYGNSSRLEYDFVVAPAADLLQIGLVFDGVHSVQIDDQGNLNLEHGMGSLRLHKPVAYQMIDGVKSLVAARYSVEENQRIHFEVDHYDRTKPIVIDPVLSYSTYLGGSGDDSPAKMAVDSDGNAYVTGTTSSRNLPIDSLLGLDFAGGSLLMSDAFVTKLNPAGTAVLYSTYLGGSGDDGGADITVDSQGNAYVVGSTSSSDFPTVQAFQPSHSGGSEVLRADAFIAKIDPTGSQLVYSTYLGGSGDDLGIGVAVDSANSAYVTGETVSLDFPVMNAMQPAPRGLTDGFVVKLNPSGSELVYGTYLGGNGTDGIHAIAVDMSGSAFLTGATESTDFPTVNGFQQANAGSGDGFVTKVGPTGALLNYSTYIGGESDDTGSDIAVDSEGNAYVAGFTGSSGFPVVNAAQPEFGNTDLLGFDAFAAKITADGSALAYSTFLGGSEIDLGFGIAVDSQGNAYVTGETDSVDFPISDAVQPLPGGAHDGFVVKVNPDGSAFEYATYLGGSSHDSASAVALDASGAVYVTGIHQSGDSPVSFGAFQANNAGGSDALITKIVLGTPPAAVATVSAASFKPGADVAPESIVSGFGADLAGATQVAT